MIFLGDHGRSILMLTLAAAIPIRATAQDVGPVDCPAAAAAGRLVPLPSAILIPDSAGGWDSGSIRSLSRLGRLDDGYVAVYLGTPEAAPGVGPFGIGVVATDDGRTWTRLTAGPILDHRDLGLDAAQRFMPGHGHATATGYVFPVTVRGGESGPWRYFRVQLDATASVVESIEEMSGLAPASTGQWDSRWRAITSLGRAPDGGSVAFFDGSDFRAWAIGRADSADGRSWRVHDDPATTPAPFAGSDPVVRSAREPDEVDHLFAGSVWQESTGAGWRLLYAGGPADHAPAAWGVGLARSPDGLDWSIDRAHLVPPPTDTVASSAGWFEFPDYGVISYALESVGDWNSLGIHAACGALPR